jgi:hypothetical protein
MGGCLSLNNNKDGLQQEGPRELVETGESGEFNLKKLRPGCSGGYLTARTCLLRATATIIFTDVFFFIYLLGMFWRSDPSGSAQLLANIN